MSVPSPETPPTGVLVVAPDVTFAALDLRLEALGWVLGEESQEAPLLPGEPAWCTYRHGAADARLHSTFNPVVRLRVLEVTGADAPAQWARAVQHLPCVTGEVLRALLDSADVREVLLGLLTVGVTGERSAVERVARLREHPDAQVAAAARTAHARLVPPGLAEAVQRLADAQRAEPGVSAVFAHLPDVEERRQVLRWLVVDQERSRPEVDAVLRAGLRDADAEVRLTALLAAARLDARAVLPEVRAMAVPQSVAEGADARDVRFWARVHGLVTVLLAGRAPPEEGTPEHARVRRLRAALTGPVRVEDDATLLLWSLTTPLQLEGAPERLPEAVEAVEDGYRLRRSGVPLVWVGAQVHWLGEGETLRQAPGPGCFMARAPLSRATARWVRLPFPGAVQADDAAPHLCDAEEAERLVQALARAEGVGLEVPTRDAWECAARGPDGRRFPWGNGLGPGCTLRPSPWGVERACGSEAQWVRVDGVLRPCGGRERPGRAGGRSAAPDTQAAVRLALRPA